MGRHVYDVVGYTGDADVYCPPCATATYGDLTDIARPAYYPFQDVLDGEGNDVQPVFAGDEFDDQPYCCVCHTQLDVVVIGKE